MKWAINTFKPFKSAKPDQIFPALLQEWLKLIVGPLTRTLTACLALGYMPRVVFIPKAGKTSYSPDKDFRPISLSSFFLKTLEKLVDPYVKNFVLQRHLLHHSQHAYCMDYSTEIALHAAVSFIESQKNGYEIGSFLDIEDVSLNASLRGSEACLDGGSQLR